MYSEFILITIPPILSAVILGGLFVFGLTRFSEPVGKVFTLSMLCMFIWAAGAAIELFVPSVYWKVVLEDIQHIGIAWMPIFWVLLTLHITGREMPHRIVTLLLCGISLGITAIILTDPYHHLFIESVFTETTAQGIRIVGINEGPLYTLLFIPYEYTLFGLSILILLESMLSTRMLFRLHYMLMLLSTVLPFGVNFLYLQGLTPYSALDPTTSILSVTGCMVAISIFKYRMLALIPMARGQIIESLQDGILVLDTENRIIDYNPVAGTLLLLHSKLIGRSAEEAFKSHPEFNELSHHQGRVFEMIISTDDAPRRYTVRPVPFSVRDGRSMGTILIMHDTTDESILMEKLKYSATHDSLTAILNRQTLLSFAENRLKTDNPELFTVMMLDIDHFKNVNDTYGHIAGDKVLRMAADVLRKCLRDSDLLGRYGGEEFIIILNRTKSDEALVVAERIRSAVEDYGFSEHGQQIRITASIGISTTMTGQGEQVLNALIHQADQALYQAKASGRNRCIQSDGTE